MILFKAAPRYHFSLKNPLLLLKMKAIQTSVIETGTGNGKKSIEHFTGYYLCF